MQWERSTVQFVSAQTLLTALLFATVFVSTQPPFVDASFTILPVKGIITCTSPRSTYEAGLTAGRHIDQKLSAGGGTDRALLLDASRWSHTAFCMNKLLQSTSNHSDDEYYTNASMKDKTLGVLVLLTVPLAWGTYAPFVKFIYKMDPPVPGFVFSTAYYLIASASLLFLVNIKADDIVDSEAVNHDMNGVDDMNEEIDGEIKMDAMNTGVPLPIQGGVELGSYLFLGNCLQVIGLQTVPADRAAFLVQLTTIMVPLAQAAFARDLFAISTKTWVACLLAFGGVLVMGFDGKELSTSVGDKSMIMTPSLLFIADTFSEGDFLIIMAAVAYTMHVIRLGKYAQSTTPLQLAAAKASSEAIMSLILIFGLVSINNGDFGSDVPSYLETTGREVAVYISTFGDSLAAADTRTLLPALGACLWTGWVTCAYTIYAQSFGQRRVSPTDANLIYTTQPLFSSLFAFVLLGETLGIPGIFGGTLIAAALWVITVPDDDGNDVANNVI